MQGLVTKERQNLDPEVAPFARSPGETEGLIEGASLVEVVIFMLSILAEMSPACYIVQ